MILKSYDLKNHIKEKINIYLLYGENSDLIDEVIEKNLKPITSKNHYNYEESEILLNKENFEESLTTKSFFEEDKLLIINRATDKIFEIIEQIYKNKDDDLKIILKSGTLEKKSKLRNFFEKTKDIIVIPFYEDTKQSLQYITQNFFREIKIKISPQNINFIIEKSKGSRINLKSELEKIKNFCQGKKSIEFNDLLKLTCSAKDYEISELADECLAKNKKKTILMLNEFNASIEDNILILKSFLFKLKRLKKLKEEMESNKNQDQVLSSYKPPIFWKDKEIIKRQLNNLTINDIKIFIKKVSELELLVKKNSILSNEITNNFIFETIENSNNLI